MADDPGERLEDLDHAFAAGDKSHTFEHHGIAWNVVTSADAVDTVGICSNSTHAH
jgi:hypothetical protein